VGRQFGSFMKRAPARSKASEEISYRRYPCGTGGMLAMSIAFSDRTESQ
jgi:hypothetical protein